MRKRTISLLAIGLSALALPALAMPPAPNVALTHGFDDGSNVLVFGVSDWDADSEEASCQPAQGPFEYELDPDDEEGAVVLNEPEGPASSDSSGDGPLCEVRAIDVTGPNGQVNHGQVVRAFVHALDQLGLRGHGCVVRTIAQTDYGKGDDQIKTSDVTGTDREAASEGGSVDLETAMATCSSKSKSPTDPDAGTDLGEPERGDGHGNGNGRPEHAGNGNGKSNGNGNGNGNGRR